MSRVVVILALVLSFLVQPLSALAEADCSCCEQEQRQASAMTDAAASDGCCDGEAGDDAPRAPDGERDCDCPRSCCVGVVKQVMGTPIAGGGLGADGPASTSAASDDALHPSPHTLGLKRPPRATVLG